MEKRILQLSKYNKIWIKNFIKEKQIITKILKNELTGIYHIGSTSINSIVAKPIIDILVSVRNINKIDKYYKLFYKNGYIAEGEKGIKGRRYFVKKDGIKHLVHIHIFEENTKNIKRHLAFKNYLIKNPYWALKYSNLKKRLNKQYKSDLEKYIEGKIRFIKRIENKALKF